MGSTKLQATLTGHSAWVVTKLAALKGKTQAEIASYLIELWIDSNSKYLREHGITYEKFDLESGGGKVVQMGRSQDG